MKRHEELLDAIDVVVWEAERATLTYTYVNRPAEALLGYPVAEWLRDGFWAARVHEDDRERVVTARRERAAAGDHDLEYRMLASDGRVVWVRDRAQVGEGLLRGTLEDISDEKRRLDAVRAVTEEMGALTGEAFLHQLVLHLTRALQVEHALVGTLDPSGRDRVRTAAVASRGQIVDNFTYDLAGTPCANVIGQRLCLYDRGVQSLFPEDVLLAEIGVESYMGMPLNGSGGRPLGILVVLGSQPLRYPEIAEGLLRMFAGRAAAELERQHAEEALRASEERYREMFENANALVYTHDFQGNLTSANRMAMEVTGYSKEDLPGLNMAQVVAPEHLELARQMIARKLRDQQPTLYPLDLIAKDGRRTPVMMSTRLIMEDGKPVGVQGIAVDISERRRAEEALRASEERYRLLFESNPHPMWIYDRETLRFLEVNDAAVRHYGYTREEFLAMTIEDIRPEEKAPRLAARSGVWSHRTKKGQVIEVEVVSAEIVVGGRSARVVLADDVTERRRLEEELRQSQKMEAVGRLAGGIAHDFNNLLTAITGYSELLLEGMPPQDSRRAEVEQIRKAGKRAASLTRQLLAFSRKQMMQLQVLDLNRVAGEMEKVLGRVIGENIRLESNKVVSPAWVKADVAQLEQVILNLVLNARDAMPCGGTLRLETSLMEVGAGQRLAGLGPGRYVELRVSDTGEGMDVATQARLFEPFFTTKAVGKGTGLGLSMVYGIVKQSGGDIEVSSEPGRGTTFRIFLPQAAPHEEAPPAEAPARPEVGRGTVLVVEDEARVRALVQEVLEGRGYRVLAVGSGREAEDLRREQPERVDLLLTDVVLPGMSGPELFQRLAEDNPDLRVVFMSGYADEAMTGYSEVVRRERFLSKPFTVDRLVRKVAEVMGG